MSEVYCVARDDVKTIFTHGLPRKFAAQVLIKSLDILWYTLSLYIHDCTCTVMRSSSFCTHTFNSPLDHVTHVMGHVTLVLDHVMHALCVM